MTLADILASLFPAGHQVAVYAGVVTGQGPRATGNSMTVIGVEGRLPLGIDEALTLSRFVLDAVRRGGDEPHPGRKEPILVLIDSDSQRMSKRDELLGLNEYLAHLAKCLLYADRQGHPTVGLLYGHTAAGAFIATALATRLLLALPGAEPAVMDLPSMARVTKLSIDVLQQMATATPVFAPGLENLMQLGGVASLLDPKTSLALQVETAIAALVWGSSAGAVDIEPSDARDRLGLERGGRPKAAQIAERVRKLALVAR